MYVFAYVSVYVWGKSNEQLKNKKKQQQLQAIVPNGKRRIRIVVGFFASVLCPRFTYETAVLTPFGQRDSLPNTYTLIQSGRQI